MQAEEEEDESGISVFSKCRSWFIYLFHFFVCLLLLATSSACLCVDEGPCPFPVLPNLRSGRRTIFLIEITTTMRHLS